jgi:peptide/nickel transport system substrate-binding protein
MKVDTEGNQLPYLDQFVELSTETDLVAMKCTTGDSDLQARGLTFTDITLLRENEDKGGYETRLWQTGSNSSFTLQPTLSSCQDEVLRQIMLDKRFRVALSHAIDRQEINNALYKGFAIPMQPELLPGVEGYNETWAKAYTEYDPDKANALLDEMGLEWDQNHQYRLRPDGEPLHLVIEDSGEDPLTGDFIELITPTFEGVGIKVSRKSTERATYRDRMRSGAAAMGYGGGGCFNGLRWMATEGPRNCVPVEAGSSGPMWGSQWALWHESDGEEGSEPPDWVKRVQELAEAWKTAPSTERQEEIVLELRELWYENFPCIGTLGGLTTPVVVKNGFRNVPKEGWSMWDPGGYLGWCEVSHFWEA